MADILDEPSADSPDLLESRDDAKHIDLVENYTPEPIHPDWANVVGNIAGKAIDAASGIALAYAPRPSVVAQIPVVRAAPATPAVPAPPPAPAPAAAPPPAAAPAPAGAPPPAAAPAPADYSPAPAAAPAAAPALGKNGGWILGLGAAAALGLTVVLVGVSSPRRREFEDDEGPRRR